MSSIPVDQLASKITSTLAIYSAETTKKIKKAADLSIKMLVEDSKRDAPTRTGNYKSKISSKTEETGKYGKKNIWYVKAPNHAQAHLLEDGHAIKRGGRVIGQAKAKPHINANAEKAIAAFERGVEEALKGGT